MLIVPCSRIFRAHPRKVRPGALGPPQMGPVYCRFFKFGIVPVPGRLEEKRPHRLGVAIVTPLTDIDVAAFDLNRFIGDHLFYRW